MTSTLKFDRWQNTSGTTIADVSSGGFPGRNLLYNGAMQVAQRGTSSTGITASGYNTADRWATVVTTMGTWTNTVETDGPTGSGFTKSFKLECTTADAAPAGGDQVSVRQYLEGQDLQGLKKGTSSAESLTLSFWVKSNVTGTYIARLIDQDNTRSIGASYTILSSGTWEKKTITFAGDTTGAFDNDNQLSLQVVFFLGAGSNFTSGTLNTSWEANLAANYAVGQTNLAASTSNYWQVTGVQLEAGTVATPFEHKAYGVELAECQRYYWMITQGNGEAITMGANYSASLALGAIHVPVTMRVTPSIIQTTGTNYFGFYRNGGVDGFDSFTTGNSNVNVVNIYNETQISGTVGHGGQFRTNSASADIAFSAEL